MKATEFDRKFEKERMLAARSTGRKQSARMCRSSE